MSINIRQKGQSGEREIANLLNDMIDHIRLSNDLAPLGKKDAIFQRNQNQSAVGGHDLSNNLGLAIEVKRQENLAISSWWKQCVDSAKRTNGIPILIFRQNRKAWRIMMSVSMIGFPGIEGQAGLLKVKVELNMDDFMKWFGHYYSEFLANGRIPESA